MLITALSHEGYFDYFNSDKNEISQQQSANIINRRKFGAHQTGTTRRFEFIFCPMIGFLASPDLLMKDCELKISFDRANAANAILEYDTVHNAYCEVCSVEYTVSRQCNALCTITISE